MTIMSEDSTWYNGSSMINTLFDPDLDGPPILITTDVEGGSVSSPDQNIAKWFDNPYNNALKGLC